MVVRVFHGLYAQIISLENLFRAWQEFKRGKRNKNDVIAFERNLENNIFFLHDQLVEKSYKHGLYKDFYITDPKLRHIYKASIFDRLIHHAVFIVLNPLFEPTFIANSYSCRKGYGAHKGFKKLVLYCRKLSKNYTKNCWALKSDIRKFFDSVDHAVFLEIISRRIQDNDTLLLLRGIIDSYHTSFGKGIPIGNLTSQLFTNIYLNELDQFVKHELRVHYYLRYADDFIILHKDKKLLQKYLLEIELFLEKFLQLKVHPQKTLLRRLDWGIDFVGYVALPHYQVIRTKTKQRIFKNVKKRMKQYENGTIDKQRLKQSVASYLGVLKHAHAHKLETSLKKIVDKDYAIG